jgi:hypothetical protein
VSQWSFWWGASLGAVSFLTLPIVPDYLSANFTWQSTTLAAMHVAVFGYAVHVYLGILGTEQTPGRFVGAINGAPTGEPALDSSEHLTLENSTYTVSI